MSVLKKLICFIDSAKAFDSVNHNKLWKILKEMGIPDHHLTCLLRNLYAGQEATVTTGHETRDCFQIGEGIHQGCILSPCLFNLYAEYIMWSAGLDHKLESKLPGEISTNSDMQMTAPFWQKKWKGTKESLDNEERGDRKSWLELNIQKTKVMASGPITSWKIDGETMETVMDFIFLDSKITVDADSSHEIKRCLLLGRKSMTNLDSILKSRDITLLTKVSYGFSNSHIWIWDLDHKKGWVLKNSCFWTVVLEKTLESPLDCKEIKSVSPKGN